MHPDGRHGSVFFEEGCSAKLFSQNELDELLANTNRTNLHTDPFYKTPDGQDEMVVVFSRLFRYFIIATQTCDVSSKDKAPYDWATILPVITLAYLCKTEPMPFPATNKTMTIHDFVIEHCDNSEQLHGLDDTNYPNRLRQIVDDSTTSAHNKKIRMDVKHLRNFLSKYFEKTCMFSLPRDIEFGLPESYVDFTAAFTVYRSKLLTNQSCRLATITDPYRIDFAKKFGEFFARIALPKPMRPT